MVFLDTEFTDLVCPALLSFAMVSLDSSEIYGELDLAQDPIGQQRRNASSNFTIRTVISQFDRMPRSKCSARELGNRAGEWLMLRAAEAGGQIRVAYDYDEDFALLRGSMVDADIWDRVHPLLIPVNIDCHTCCARGDQAAEASWLESSLFRGIKRHHALADALALRAAWQAVCC